MIENFKKVKALQSISNAGLTLPVWSPHLHSMPRLSTTRHPPRSRPLVHYTLPSIRGIYCGVGSCTTSKEVLTRQQEEEWSGDTRRELCSIRGRASKVPIDLETHSLDPWHQCDVVSPDYIRYRLLLHPPPLDWDIE